ncbi:MAG: cytochrome c maturation protein CcmE [Pseudomonadota bacterium]
MNKKQKRLAFVGSLVAVAALAAGLVLTALGSSVAYFYTPSDLANATSPPTGQIRLGGLVRAGSVARAEGADASVAFTVEDEFAATPVTFAGVLPDLFREGQGVVVQGALGPDGVLLASEVLAKHDETYMPREVADALKEQGRWREGE